MKLTDFAIEVECPNCGQVTVTREDFVQGSYDVDGVVQIMFKCPSCEAQVKLESKVDSSATDALTALAVSSSEIIAMTDTAIRGSSRIVVETTASPSSDGALSVVPGEEIWMEPSKEIATGGKELGKSADEEQSAASNNKTADLSACVDAISDGRYAAVSNGRLGESDLEDIDIEEPESIERIVRSIGESAESVNETLSANSGGTVSAENSGRSSDDVKASADAADAKSIADEPVDAAPSGAEAVDVEDTSKDAENSGAGTVGTRPAHIRSSDAGPAGVAPTAVDAVSADADGAGEAGEAADVAGASVAASVARDRKTAAAGDVVEAASSGDVDKADSVDGAGKASASANEADVEVAGGATADIRGVDEVAKSGNAAEPREPFGSEDIGGCATVDAVDGAEIDEPADYRSVESAGAGNGDETSATPGAGSDDGAGESTGTAGDVEAGKPARTDDAGEAAASAGTAHADGEQGSSEEEEPQGVQQQGKPAKSRLNIRYTVLGGNSMASFGVEIGRKSRTGKQQSKPQAEYTPTDEDLARLEYFHRQLESLDTVDEAIDEIDSGYNFSDADENEDDDKDE